MKVNMCRFNGSQIKSDCLRSQQPSVFVPLSHEIFMFLNVKCHIISCTLELIDGPGPSCIYTVFISAFQGYICITSTKDTDTLSLLKYKKKKVPKVTSSGFLFCPTNS